MSSTLLEQRWTPPFERLDMAVSTVTVASLPTRIAVVLEVPDDAATDSFRTWIIMWLREWLRTLPLSERSLEVTFFCMGIGRIPHGDDKLGQIQREGPVIGLSYGMYPSAPDDWKETSVEDLVLKAC